MTREILVRENTAHGDDRARLREKFGCGINELVADPRAVSPRVGPDLAYRTIADGACVIDH